MENNVTHPSHYTHGVMECIDEMRMLFPVEEVLAFCKLNVWKYRARAPYKGQMETDLAKADAYLLMYQKIKDETGSN